MDEPLRLTLSDVLTYADLRQVCEILREGGLCVLPSDTCYSLAALPFRRDAIARIARILPGKDGDAIPLAFGSLAIVEQWVKLSPHDRVVIDEFWPGPVTLVCEIGEWHDKPRVGEMLHTRGNIGVRITTSTVECQISNHLQRPITTCAVRGMDGTPVRSFDDALSVVRSRIAESGETFPIAAIRVSHIPYSTVSTVATLQQSQSPSQEDRDRPYTLHVFRTGEIEPRRIERVLRNAPRKDDSS